MTGAGTRIVLLGRLAVERDGVPAGGSGLSGRRAELVFAFLAVEHRRSVSRDELADALWPGLLPDTWNAALRGVLSDVRRFLAGAGLDPVATLVAEHGRLQLRLPDGAAVDVDEARKALDAARTLRAAGEPTAAAAASGRAAEAAALPFLPHHENSWVDGVRSELDALHVDALELHARALSESGDLRAAAAAADRLVHADPFVEAAHRLQIEILGRAGDRAGALKAYEHCRAVLGSELGIEPSAETEAALRGALDERGRAPAAGGFGGYSVLVVEDHDFQRRTALTLLRGLGVGTLSEAADGHAALALLETSAPPDVIVCDIDMPGMDGMAFIRNVAERRLASAVAIASGLDARLIATVRAAGEAYGLQVLGAVAKPLTARALDDLLSAYRPPPPSVAGDDPAGAAAALTAALEDGSLVVDFEPIVDLALGSVSGVIAVPRPPAGVADDLHALADAAGLGTRFAERVLRLASEAVPGDLDVDVWAALPASALSDVALADALAAVTRDRVVLVIDAAAARRHGAAALEVLARLRVKGFGLCLDGLEAGGGALERLPLTHARLEAHAIALAAATGQVDALREAVDAARAVGVKVVGDCTSADDYALLLALGCSFAHGSYLAVPLPAAGLAGGVRAWTAPDARR